MLDTLTLIRRTFTDTATNAVLWKNFVAACFAELVYVLNSMP